MARTAVSISDVAKVAEHLARASEILKTSVEKAKAANIGKVWIHWGSAASVYVPKSCEWVAGVEIEIARAIVAEGFGTRAPGERNSSAYKTRMAGGTGKRKRKSGGTE